jgi:site-specific DNA-methyltransferase (adenine-specific)
MNEMQSTQPELLGEAPAQVPADQPADHQAEPQKFLGDRVTLYAGDCMKVLAQIPDCSIDSGVTDAPYHLQSIHKRFAAKGRDETSERYAAGPYGRHATGFMGKKWDGGDIAFRPELWAEVFRVLKPGAFLLAFSGTRTYHRMVCAIEDAGFEIRDQIGWAFGTGFPKSLNVAKAMRKAGHDGIDAAVWEGWGTSLKPAWEPICLARKPLVGTVIANAREHGTGALNIDGCRIFSDGDLPKEREGEDSQDRRYTDEGATNFSALPGRRYTVKRLKPGATLNKTGGNWRPEEGGVAYHGTMKPGRWPANLVHDGSDEVLAAFPQTGVSSGGKGEASRKSALAGPVYGGYSGDVLGQNAGGLGDRGSAARFFYSAKAKASDRLGSKHPTVKPLDLMQWLVRLVTPRGGVVIDPFAGTGTTGEAAWREGMRAILIEADQEYLGDIAYRMDLADKPTKRAAVIEALKRKTELMGSEELPLFADAAAAATAREGQSAALS